MGTLFSSPQSRVAFTNQTFAHGLNRLLSKITLTDGSYRAASSASFRSGAPVMLNSSGEVVISDGKACIGIAMADKMTLGSAVVVDEEISFDSVGDTAQLTGQNSVTELRLSSGPNGSGTIYTESGPDQYDVTSGGLVTHVATIPTDGTVVYATYRYALVEADYEFEGKNFWNSNDEVTIQDGRVAVALAPALIFTTEFETDVATPYATTGLGSNIYINSSGLFTTTVGSNKLVGHVIQVPTADQPFLGFQFHNTVTANTA